MPFMLRYLQMNLCGPYRWVAVSKMQYDSQTKKMEICYNNEHVFSRFYESVGTGFFHEWQIGTSEDFVESFSTAVFEKLSQPPEGRRGAIDKWTKDVVHVQCYNKMRARLIMAKIGVIGLGSMSRPIARNLLAAGHEVIVWNRSSGPVDELVALGARRAATPLDAYDARIVFSMLSNDSAVREVLLEQSLLNALSAGSLHVNLSTVSAELAREATRLHAERGVGYVSAPVFGRVAVAESGKLNIVVAGPAELIRKAQPFFDVIGDKTWPVGEEPEQANVVKIIGNYLIACAIQSLSEAISLAEAKGIDARTLMSLFTATLFPGRIYESYGEIIAGRKYRPAGFTTTLGKKDLQLALDSAREADIPLPIGDLLRTVFDAAMAAGHADDDWAVIAEMQPRPKN